MTRSPGNSLTQRLIALIKEFMQFGMVGAAAYVIDVSLFNLVQHGPTGFLSGHPNSAQLLASAIATVFSWLANRYWTYRGRTQKNVAREASLFITANLGGIAITQFCLLFTHHVLGLTSPLADNIAAYIVGFGLGTAFRFIFYHYIVFTGHKNRGAGHDADTDSTFGVRYITQKPLLLDPQTQPLHSRHGTLGQNRVKDLGGDGSGQLRELGEQPLEGSDLLPDDTSSPQAQACGQLRVSGDDGLHLGDGVGADRVLTQLVDESAAQRIGQRVAQRHAEVNEQPKGEIGLDQALGPVQGTQALIEVAEHVRESLGRPDRIDAVHRCQCYDTVKGPDLPGAHAQQVDPGTHLRGTVGILGIARACRRPRDGDDAHDGELVGTDLHRRGGAGLR